MSIINTILAKDERAARYIQVMSQFHRGISDIEAEEWKEKIWKEKYPESIYYYFRYNWFKFVSKRQWFEESMMDEYQDSFMDAIKCIPDEVFETLQTILTEAKEAIWLDVIGQYNKRRDKVEKTMLKGRNKLSQEATDYQAIEGEFLQLYLEKNADNIKAYMQKQYKLEED